LNLLQLAANHACHPRKCAGLFLDGLQQWLRAERVRGEMTAEMVMFSNFAAHGDFTQSIITMPTVVGIYYVKTADYGRHRSPYRNRMGITTISRQTMASCCCTTRASTRTSRRYGR